MLLELRLRHFFNDCSMLTNPTVPPAIQGSRLFVEVADGTGGGNILPKVVDLGEVGLVAGEWHALVIWHKRSSAYLFNKDYLEASLLPAYVLAPWVCALHVNARCFRVPCSVLCLIHSFAAANSRFTCNYAPREQYRHQISVHQPARVDIPGQGPPRRAKVIDHNILKYCTATRETASPISRRGYISP